MHSGGPATSTSYISSEPYQYIIQLINPKQNVGTTNSAHTRLSFYIGVLLSRLSGSCPGMPRQADAPLEWGEGTICR